MAIACHDPFIAVCTAVRETLGLRLEHYRSRQLERRLEFFRQRHGLGSLLELAQRLRADTGLRQEFADFLTINVSEFFRNPEQFARLQDTYLPALLAERPALRIWSAGCSIGAEIYSIAMLLAGLAPGRRHCLLATDIDQASLRRAAAGIYTAQEVRSVPDPLRRRFFRLTPAGWELDPAIRRQVEFRRHDLLGDPFPQGLDLIACRNVVIYFTEAAKAELYKRFQASLRPGGLLFIGATETIHDASSLGFRYLSPCFYQKT